MTYATWRRARFSYSFLANIRTIMLNKVILFYRADRRTIGRKQIDVAKTCKSHIIFLRKTALYIA